jgi:hypothetical protein
MCAHGCRYFRDKMLNIQAIYSKKGNNHLCPIAIKMDKNGSKMAQNGFWAAINLPQISQSKSKGFAHEKTLAFG